MKYVDNRTCSVESCPNTTKNCDLVFCQLPSDPIRAEKWMNSLKLKPVLPKKKFFCSDHFETRSFISTLRTRLTSAAVPTLQFKVPTDESTSWEKCMESHFVWNNMNSISDSRSLKDAQSSSEDMCVIASMYLPSDDGKMNSTHVENIDQPEEKQTKYSGKGYSGKEEKKAIEKTINEYLKKRYLTDNPEEDRNLQNSTNQTKNSNSSLMTEQSHKENCASNKQVPLEKNIKENPRMSSSFNHAKRKKVQPWKDETLSCDQQNLSPPACATDVVHPPSGESNQTTNKRHIGQASSFKTESIQPIEVDTLPFHQQNFIPPAPAISAQPVSNQSGAQEITNTLNKSQLLPVKIEENFLETDADCDMFAARIAEELKRMKNPCCRAKTHFNIERILIKAKSGAYDV